MRKMIFFTFILSLAFVMEARAQFNFSFNGVGIYAGYVKPEDPIESTVGFGVRADLGTLMKDNITMGALIDYWGKQYGTTGNEVTFSSVTVAPYVHYNFVTDASIMPYAGGGLGLTFNSTEVTLSYLGYSESASSSDTGFVLFGVGGAKMRLTDKMTGFAEARYQIGDIDVLSAVFGVIYRLGR
ncbi:outer membrane beta-barrel protein [Calditrichota bacterium GD2]